MNNSPDERVSVDGQPLCNSPARAGRLCTKKAMIGTTRCYIHSPKNINETVRRVREAIHISGHHE